MVVVVSGVSSSGVAGGSTDDGSNGASKGDSIFASSSGYGGGTGD